MPKHRAIRVEGEGERGVSGGERVHERVRAEGERVVERSAGSGGAGRGGRGQALYGWDRECRYGRRGWHCAGGSRAATYTDT
jgi:hypothetical protein